MSDLTENKTDSPALQDTQTEVAKKPNDVLTTDGAESAKVPSVEVSMQTNTQAVDEKKVDDLPKDDTQSSVPRVNEGGNDKVNVQSDQKSDEQVNDKLTVQSLDKSQADEKSKLDVEGDKSSPVTQNEVSGSYKQGFGKALAKARKEKGMSVDDVAKRLNRLKRQIEAIEAEDYESLPQYAFAKGFAGSYARLVGLDDNEIGRQFEAGYPRYLREDSIEDIHSPLRPMGTLKRDRIPIRINAGLIAGIVAVLIFGVAILKMISSATKSDTDVAVQDVQVADSLTPNERAIGAALGDNPVVVTGTAVVGNASVGVLDFWLKENTTIKVVDNTGITLMTGEQKRGGYQLTGKPPFKIEISNPSRVDLNFNKNPVNLNSHTKGNKAVFTLQ